MMYSISDRSLVSIARATAIVVALCFDTAAFAVAAAEPSTSAPIATPAPAKGEFDNNSAMDLASGQVVKTDCSVNWTAPDGKVYCFSTEASKEAFLRSPDENIQKAKEVFLAKDLANDTAAAPAAAAPSGGAAKMSKEFTEEDVDKRVQEVIAERT